MKKFILSFSEYILNENINSTQSFSKSVLNEQDEGYEIMNYLDTAKIRLKQKIEFYITKDQNLVNKILNKSSNLIETSRQVLINEGSSDSFMGTLVKYAAGILGTVALGVAIYKGKGKVGKSVQNFLSKIGGKNMKEIVIKSWPEVQKSFSALNKASDDIISQISKFQNSSSALGLNTEAKKLFFEIENQIIPLVKDSFQESLDLIQKGENLKSLSKLRGSVVKSKEKTNLVKSVLDNKIEELSTGKWFEKIVDADAKQKNINKITSYLKNLKNEIVLLENKLDDILNEIKPSKENLTIPDIIAQQGGVTNTSLSNLDRKKLAAWGMGGAALTTGFVLVYKNITILAKMFDDPEIQRCAEIVDEKHIDASKEIFAKKIVDSASSFENDLDLKFTEEEMKKIKFNEEQCKNLGIYISYYLSDIILETIKATLAKTLKELSEEIINQTK